MDSPSTPFPNRVHGTAIAALLIFLAILGLDLLWNRHIYTTTTDLLLLEWLLRVGLCFMLPLVWELAHGNNAFQIFGLTRARWADLRTSLLVSAALLLCTVFAFGPSVTFGGGEIGSSWMAMYAFSSMFVMVHLYGWCLHCWREAWGRTPALVTVGAFFGLAMGGDGRFRPILFGMLWALGIVLAYLVERRRSLLVAWPFPIAFAGLFVAHTTVAEVSTATLWEMAMFARITVPTALIFVVLLVLIFRGIWPKRLSILLGGLYATAIGLTLYGWGREIPLRTAQVAKYVCSGVFVSGRKAKDVRNDDMSFVKHVKVKVDRKTKIVSATYLGLGKRRALYRPRLGCTLLQGKSELTLQKRAKSVQRLRTPRASNINAPRKPGTSWVLARQKLRQLISPLFVRKKKEPAPGTKAIVVLHKGRLLIERYAEGYSAKTPLLGHSLTKTVTGALAGILLARKKLSLDQRIFTGDSAGGDVDRKALQVHHLLHMTSGLSFSEDYLRPFSDLTVMLYGRANGGGYVMGLDLAEKPGKRWRYETGTTMLLSTIMRNAFGSKAKQYQRFPHRALFRPLGMRSAVLEQDATGTYLGGSHMYATARDWARFGLLYMRDGKVNKRRILSKKWMAYTKTPSPKAPLGIFGANIWLNGGSESGQKKRRWKRPKLADWLRLPRTKERRVRLFPQIPPDAVFGIGYGGQLLAMLPGQGLVIVRLSHGMDETWGMPDHHKLLKGVLKATAPLRTPEPK